MNDLIFFIDVEISPGMGTVYGYNMNSSINNFNMTNIMHVDSPSDDITSPGKNTFTSIYPDSNNSKNDSNNINNINDNYNNSHNHSNNNSAHNSNHKAVMQNISSSSSTFIAYNFDKILETPQPKTEKIKNEKTEFAKPEFAFNDSHSPVSASKFIERSLHDLDDLINQRRLELSELKRSNQERIPYQNNPLHDINYRKLLSPSLLSPDIQKTPVQLTSPSVRT